VDISAVVHKHQMRVPKHKDKTLEIL